MKILFKHQVGKQTSKFQKCYTQRKKQKKESRCTSSKISNMNHNESKNEWVPISGFVYANGCSRGVRRRLNTQTTRFRIPGWYEEVLLLALANVVLRKTFTTTKPLVLKLSGKFDYQDVQTTDYVVCNCCFLQIINV